MEQQNLEAVRGDTFTLTLEFTDENSVVIDITGWTVFFTLKTSRNFNQDTAGDANAVVVKTITSHTNPTGGISTIILTATETANLLGTYHYDTQYKKTDGTVITPIIGIVTFEKDVSRRTA